MKIIKFIKPFLTVMILLAVLSSCKKDENLNTGNVMITIVNLPSDIVIYISPIENPLVFINDGLRPDNTGKLVKSLNIGNYILTCSSSTTFLPKVGFQIQAGKTTVINYDANNIGHVQ